MPSLGSIRLHDSVDPALDSGSYRIRTHSDTRDPSRPLAENIQRFEIVGPRFTLEPADVLARRPAADAVGAFGEDVPYIVLSRRTLPWERRGLGAGSPAGTPWLALVVLRKDECELRDDVAIADVVGSARAPRFPAATKVRSVTIKAPRTLGQLMPRANELPLLCHVREVNLADTALAMADDDGFFALVVANRIPGGSADPGTPYVAVLASLEERDDLLAGTPATQSLVVLDAWSFTSTTSGGTFRRLIRATSQAAFGAGAPTPTGHVVLGATDRGGVAGRALYRGPLAARAQGTSTGDVPTLDGPPASDHSLDVARELGRLLAAADGRFLREMVAWRRADVLAGVQQASADTVSAALSATSQTASLAGHGLRSAVRASAAARDSLPSVATVAALTRALARRARPADRWGVPDVAREQAGRLASAPHAVRTANAARSDSPPSDPLTELLRERDRIVEEQHAP